jgi:UDP-glucose 4-epimerase
MNEAPLTWVLGSGGLLGSNVEHALGRSGPVWRPSRPVRWGREDTAEFVAAAVGEFAEAAERGPWQVAWCAGSGVVATAAQHLADESFPFDALLDALTDRMPRASDGLLFVASSAGGLYGGSTGPPFTEDTPVRPISPYGELKLKLERRATTWAEANGWPTVIGRISNLYGPGQNLSKAQGLISQVCRAQLLRQPISIYVPLDTVRDYIYARDCGDLVADLLARARREPEQPVLIKILASQRGVTVGAILGELRRLFKQSIKVVHRASPTARFQATDLRLRSGVWPELDKRTLTPLPIGISATAEHITRLLQAGRV